MIDSLCEDPDIRLFFYIDPSLWSQNSERRMSLAMAMSGKHSIFRLDMAVAGSVYAKRLMQIIISWELMDLIVSNIAI